MLKLARAVYCQRLIIILGIFLIFIPVYAFSTMRTLTRTEDFIVLTGRDVPELIGSELSDLRLYSCQTNVCSPIPVQVDKIDANGRYVFPQDKNPKRDGSLLDANDELSFMAGDAGDQRSLEWKPELATKGMEIEIRDPLDGARAWVYLFIEPGSAPAKVPDYVDYQIEGDRATVRSPQFVLSWKKGHIYYDTMQMLDRSGKLGPDLLDSQRTGVIARMGKQDLPLIVPEDFIRTRDVGIIDGPVRVVLAQVMVLFSAELQIQWGTEYFLKYYRCGHTNSETFEFPSALRNIFNSVEIYWSLDFSPEILGSIYVDVNHPQTLTVTSGTVKGLPNDAPHYWWALYGDKGALLQALDIDDEVLSFYSCAGRWNQDPKAKDRKGDFPGRIEIGFSCKEFTKLPADKSFHFVNYILFPSKPTSSGVKALRNLVENPLKAAARSLSSI